MLELDKGYARAFYYSFNLSISFKLFQNKVKKKSNKQTTLVGILIMGEPMHVWMQEAYGKCLYLPPDFTVNPKLLLKIKSIKYKSNEQIQKTREI